ncbi:MAG TPA: type II toxin-antitoxin system RatA family toxin [Geminicoccus sp.]|uniref:type II toxin-antitoxin system RatA family toxin n=1 Tax=Geminicoccus sp. TaxID=2024832 RepID=UPI002BB3FDA6|nr:type II toxin-antitoxin system RatA family toxin [Geminicoccus sp.]HWL69956.1 type II toxin-antitoxin system RatA family toxin [Geminicoccus sp.]
MPTHSERRYLPYTPNQLYEIVAAVDRYPEFLPWCSAARITERQDDMFLADLVISFKVWREKFTSKVTLDRMERTIHVEYVNGPFKYMNNYWKFLDGPEGGCILDFHVDFEFKSRVLQQLIGLLFDEAVRRMVAAFEGRARKLHGDRGPSRPITDAGEIGLLPRG